MRHTLLMACALAATVTLTTVPASAQTPAPAPGRLSIGIEGGAEAVEHVGGAGGVRLGLALSSRVEVFGEALYLQDVVTRRRVESAKDVAGYLAQSQGQTASATLTAPAWTFGAGVRLFLTGPHGLRPYVVGQAGVARVTLQPAFTLAGADVTSNLGQYGVTLGSDLTGSISKPTYGGGFGVVAGRGAWTLDLALRVLSIQFDGQPANASTFVVGIGRKF